MSKPTADTFPGVVAGLPAEIRFGVLVLATLLEEARDQALLMRQPLLEGVPARLPPGCRVRLLLPSAGQCWEIPAEVDRQGTELGESVWLHCRGRWRRHLERGATRVDRRLAVEIIGGARDIAHRTLCVTRNISETGFAALLDPSVELAPGLAVDVNLFFSIHSPPLRLNARCVRHRKLPGRLWGRVEAGFEFIGLSEGDRSQLREAIERTAAKATGPPDPRHWPAAGDDRLWGEESEHVGERPANQAPIPEPPRPPRW